MSDEPYWEVTLPDSQITVKGNWTREQAKEAILTGITMYVEENLRQVRPKPPLPDGITVSFGSTPDDAAVPQEAEGHD